MASAPIVIVGAGMAAYGVARELRKRDPDTALTIISTDAGAAYAKPMLSNAIALGKAPAQLVSHSAAHMAAQLNATILTQTTVTAIERDTRTLATSGGPVGYSQLVLALGARPIRLPIGGDAAGQVLSVNHLADYAELRARLERVAAPARVTIIGAGLIGCEFADDLLAGGHHVTLVDPNPRPLAALAAPSLSHGLAQAWNGRSLDLRLGTTVERVERASAALQVSLASGVVLTTDLVLSAVGLRPAIELAQAAQLATGRGIVVDDYGRTSDSAIFALGDCAEYSTASGARVLPYVAPLMAAARAIGATLAGSATAIALTNDAVIVKTPSYKLALSPPPPQTRGAWIDEHDGERTIARFIDEQGVLRGFGLSAHTPALRQKLLGEM
ncbi:MAG TPA: FAD-dependent oxidoreductase [Telluria sp.]|jgi:rubredoxin-NAD+ reductase